MSENEAGLAFQKQKHSVFLVNYVLIAVRFIDGGKLVKKVQ